LFPVVTDKMICNRSFRSCVIRRPSARKNRIASEVSIASPYRERFLSATASLLSPSYGVKEKSRNEAIED
jgi:hypothetical protein